MPTSGVGAASPGEQNKARKIAWFSVGPRAAYQSSRHKASSPERSQLARAKSNAEASAIPMPPAR
jgi:hypothetical protein